jgi:hypothetical protein
MFIATGLVRQWTRGRSARTRSSAADVASTGPALLRIVGIAPSTKAGRGTEPHRAECVHLNPFAGMSRIRFDGFAPSTRLSPDQGHPVEVRLI